MEVNIAGEKVSIIYKDYSEDDNHGHYESETKTITIDKDLKGDAKVRVELHEIIHAFVDILGWHDVLEGHSEELLCNQIPMILIKNFDIKPKNLCEKNHPDQV